MSRSPLEPKAGLGGRIRPERATKLTTLAGFELGTGVLINIVPPEQATEDLRLVVPA